MQRLIVLFTCLLTVSFTNTVVHADDVWQAGMAKTIITPPTAMWMSGYASRTKPAEGTIHDLYAKALAISDPAGHKILIVTLDLVGIDGTTSKTICEQLVDKHGLQRSGITISTSHTHSGPIVGRNLMSMYSLDDENIRLIAEYTQFLSDSILKISADALANLQPATLQFGSGQATFAVNRRNNREPDVPTLRAAGQLVGPVDHDVPLLVVRAPDGSLRTVLFLSLIHISEPTRPY